MKVLGGGVLWAVNAGMFVRWNLRIEREKSGVLTWADVEPQLHATSAATPEIEHPQPH